MKATMLITAALLAGAGAAALAQNTPDIAKVSVRMRAVEKSGEAGTARLTALGSERTQVDITVKGAPKGVAQPAHIHEGTCDKLNPQPKWGLNNVVNGKSRTQVPVGLEALQGGEFAINVHKSAENISVYVSCGQIPRAAAQGSKPGKARQ